MKINSIGNGKGKRNSTSSHYRINLTKRTIQINHEKISNHEHHRATDKECAGTHNAKRQAGSKLFRSGKRQLQKQTGRTGGADRLFRLLVLDSPEHSKDAHQRAAGGTHWQGKRKGMDSQRRRSEGRFKLPYLEHQTASRVQKDRNHTGYHRNEQQRGSRRPPILTTSIQSIFKQCKISKLWHII